VRIFELVIGTKRAQRILSICIYEGDHDESPYIELAQRIGEGGRSSPNRCDYSRRLDEPSIYLMNSDEFGKFCFERTVQRAMNERERKLSFILGFLLFLAGLLDRVKRG
jgi:hypothetical protein